jgi:RNA polymerase sigma-32 factor
MAQQFSGDDASLARYIARARAIPTLTREEEHELAVRVRDFDDKEARDRLARANLRHVVSVAISYRRYGIRLGDLVAEGNVGLATALGKFDPERGTRFVTYAVHWIRAYVLDFVLRSWSIVGAGPLRSKTFFRLRRERAKLLALTGDEQAANVALAERMGSSVERVESLLQRLEVRDVSLDVKVFDDAGASWVDTLPTPEPSQEETLGNDEEAKVDSERVRAAVATLDAREKYIVETRIMASGDDELTLAEIGRRLGVSRERARQLEERAKAKLRRQLEESQREAA